MKRKWLREHSPKEMKVGSGWFSQFDKVFVDCDRQYCVMSREIETGWGKVTHACMRNADSTDIPWAEKFSIKNDLYGSERIGVEVFPKESALVDAANMYHLWVFDKKFKLPFNLKEL